MNSPRGVKRTNSTSSGWGSINGSVNSPKAESTRNVTRGVRRSEKMFQVTVVKFVIEHYQLGKLVERYQKDCHG